MRSNSKLLFLLFFAIGLVASCSNDGNKLLASACFTPGENCTTQIIEAVNSAKKNLFIQAEDLSDTRIVNAVLDAKKRGVDVRAIFDKNIQSESDSPLLLLVQHNIPIWIDNKVAFANNNVMVIDDSKVITGSFDFTTAAQEKNAENLVILNDPALIKRYLDNWQSRVVLSQSIAEASLIKATSLKLSQNKHRAVHRKKTNKLHLW